VCREVSQYTTPNVNISLDSLKRKESLWKDEQPETLKFRPRQALVTCCKGGAHEQSGRIW
jgi:hypothetical protein